MRARYLLTVVVFAAFLPVLLPAQSADVKADFDRAAGLADKVRNKVYDAPEAPTWIGDTGRFWYRKSTRGGNAFVLADAAAGTKGPAFDHARLASSLSGAAGGTFTATTLPFTAFEFVDGQTAIVFTQSGAGAGAGRGAGRAGGAATGDATASARWRCTLSDYQCARVPAATGPAGAGRSGRQGGGAAAAGAANPNAATGEAAIRLSPDRKTEAFVQNYNVFLRPAGAGADVATPLSWDGSEGNAYTLTSLQWSPDSQKIAVYRRRPGYQRMVNFVQSSPADQVQPKLVSRFYRKPGDVVDFDQPVLFDVATSKQTIVDTALAPNPYQNLRMEWRKDSRAFTFEYNQRGHQLYRVIEVNATTGSARPLIEEASDVFVDYRRATAGLTDSGRTFRYDIDDGKEIIWMSERDGWSHLYLYDGVTGKVKHSITSGSWAVHYVEGVDEAARQIYFTANGRDAGKDPYFLHTYRINFDGTGLTRFTTGDGQHTVTWSPDRQYYVDTWSRVDLPPVSELRRARDQSLVLELERASMTDLTATGWRAPEAFVAKGRDGVTDIWGVIIRPTSFDPAQKYPVIENIYAGPQGSFVPKAFSTQTGMQTLAELGFIVVQIDGMGTANRSKAFHAVSWKNLGDAGFADRILWHKAVAAKYAYYDITRVGVYGTSAGGQNAAGAVLFHPEFYKAAAASAGCHDNRMDKIWWNEQWMGWPIGPEYAAASNVDHANELQGRLFLLVGEMDTNVDPSSTLQVVNKLIQANKEFELLVIPNADHTGGGAYGDHKRFDFFVRHLQGRVPPAWNLTALSNTAVAGVGLLDEDAMPWVASEDWDRRP